MATLTQTIPNRTMNRQGLAPWLAAVAALSTLLALLTMAIMNNPVPSQDVAVMNWVAGRDWPGLETFFAVLSFLTSAKGGVIYVSAGIAFLLILRKPRMALVFAVVGATIGFVAVLGDYTLGQVVDRGRPLAGSDNTTPAYPSGHVFGSMVFFGFMGFLAVYYKMKRNLLVPLLVVIVATILLVGPARIYEQAHWPSDVAAGYLFGLLVLLFLIPLYLRFMTIIPPFPHFKNLSPVFSSHRKQNTPALESEGLRIVRSIASVVLLDPQRGTATKVYRPPLLVRLMYWLAFQAKFPYDSNRQALVAGHFRRQIASKLTTHRFGKDLVAPVTAIDRVQGEFNFVTKYVPGNVAENDEAAKRFLTQVSETFSAAGLSVWQVNPRNPHAHTNLIRTPEGPFKIIDLESAIVTPFLGKGQWRSAFKSGNIPVFDDIDFPRLRNYIAINEQALETNLGPDGLTELRHATDHAEQSIRSWKDAEPRIWGHIISRVYRLLDWKAFFQHLMGALTEADRAAEVFLSRGIDRWEDEGRISVQQAADLRTRLSSRRAQDALRHLGAHLVLSVVIAVPVPGVRSLARFAWTMAFWVRHLRGGESESAGTSSNIHTPLVMLLTLIPVVGSVAYLAARPLRRKLLVRLMLDEVGWKLPFSLYQRMHIDRWVAPAPRKVERNDARAVTAGDRAPRQVREMFGS